MCWRFSAPQSDRDDRVIRCLAPAAASPNILSTAPPTRRLALPALVTMLASSFTLLARGLNHRAQAGRYAALWGSLGSENGSNCSADAKHVAVLQRHRPPWAPECASGGGTRQPHGTPSLRGASASIEAPSTIPAEGGGTPVPGESFVDLASAGNKHSQLSLKIPGSRQFFGTAIFRKHVWERIAWSRIPSSSVGTHPPPLPPSLRPESPPILWGLFFFTTWLRRCPPDSETARGCVCSWPLVVGRRCGTERQVRRRPRTACP
jgi:hypothetical protein